MKPRPCSAPGCRIPMNANGLCRSHDRMRAAGKPLRPIRAYRKRLGGPTARFANMTMEVGLRDRLAGIQQKFHLSESGAVMLVLRRALK